MIAERYILIHDDVKLVLNERKYDDIRLSEEDVTNLGYFVQLLSHLKDVTVVLSTEITSTASQVIPLFKVLLTQATIYAPKNDFARNLQSSRLKSIQFYIIKYKIFENLDLITLTFLDPP